MLKLGVIDVLNVLPVFYGIRAGLVPVDADLVLGRVTELNRQLSQGQLDLSVVSSFEYAQHHEKYLILPELSVSAKGPVKSIYLFSQIPLEQLRNCPIRLTEFSLTSVHLIQYLLKDQGVEFIQSETAQAPAELLIADEAIAKYYQNTAPYVYDLAELWLQKTGLPFVFALWVVRREVYEQEPEAVRRIYAALLQSKALGPTHWAAMARDFNQGIFPNLNLCEEYLANLHYDFSQEYQAGFLRFQTEMLALGKLHKIAPLKFIHL